MLSELEPIDLNGVGPVEPLKNWLAKEPPPASSGSTRNQDGSIINWLPPGYWEVALALMTKKGPLGIWEIFYWIPYGEDAYFIVSSFDDFFEGVYEILTERDFGEAMTDAVARGWPTFSRCLHDASKGDLKNGALLRFKTTRIQWGLTRGVGDIQLRHADDLFEGYGGAHFDKHASLTRDLTQETYRGLGEMPGFFEALGKGDYKTRTVKKIDSRLNTTLEIVDLAAKVFGG